MANEKEKTEKTTRTPRNYESIEKGALSLELKERVNLKNALTCSIDNELADLEAKLKSSKEIAGK